MSAATGGRVKALFDFAATEGTQLNLTEGAFYTIVDTTAGDWWKLKKMGTGGRSDYASEQAFRTAVQNATGYAPKAYVQPCSTSSDVPYDGVPLQDLAKGTGGAPQFVVELLARLVALDGHHKAGIFRWSGNHRHMKDAAASLNDGVPPAEALQHCDAGSLAGVLTRWLRGLPTKLLDPAGGPRLAAAGAEMAGDGGLAWDECWDMLGGLPPAHRDTLKALMTFLSGIDPVSTQMPAEHLAKVLAPDMVSVDPSSSEMKQQTFFLARLIRDPNVVPKPKPPRAPATTSAPVPPVAAMARPEKKKRRKLRCCGGKAESESARELDI